MVPGRQAAGSDTCDLVVSVAVWRHFFEALRVRCPNEVGLHVVDSALGVHQVLIVFAFDLDHAHDDAVDHVDGFTFVIVALTLVIHAVALLLVVLRVVSEAFTAVLVEAFLAAVQVVAFDDVLAARDRVGSTLVVAIADAVVVLDGLVETAVGQLVLVVLLTVLGSQVGGHGHLMLFSFLVILLLYHHVVVLLVQVGQAGLRLQGFFIVQEDRVRDWSVPPAF